MQDLERDLVFYLLDRGFLTYQALVDGHVTIAADRTRHHTAAVLSNGGPSYFVKQTAGHPDAAACLRREAICYELARENAAFESLTKLLPDLLLYDQDRQLLVLELLPEAENAAVAHRRLGRCPRVIGRRLGDALGRYHGADIERHRAAFHEDVFAPQRPWILSFDLDGEKTPYGLSPANEELLRRVRAEPAIVAGLAELRREWRLDALIHGDMKWENCVLYPRLAPVEDLRLKIVDWEAATLGDARWDAGSLLSSYLSSLVLSPTSGEPPADAREARKGLAAIQPAMRAFEARYQSARGEVDVAQHRDLTLTFAAARLLLTAFELQVFAPQPLLQAGVLYALAADFFRHPEKARHELLAA